MANTISPFHPFSVLDDVFRGFPGAAFGRSVDGFVPALETEKSGSDLQIKVDLPGLDPEKDIDIELHGRNLTISGERRDETNGDGVHEVRYGKFSRSLALPAKVSEDAVSANYDKGVLTVRVDGAYAEVSPKKIAVSGGTDQTQVTTTAEDANGEAAAK